MTEKIQSNIQFLNSQKWHLSRQNCRVGYTAPLILFAVFLMMFFCERAFCDGQMNRLVITTTAPLNKELECIYRVPKTYNADSQIMVLFGGRNWKAQQTYNTYQFNDFADKHGLFLISPSFCDDDYWEPEKWSGKALFQAISELEIRYRLKSKPLFYYGYSAGGQCVALFYNYAPDRVAAWALHASGVYFNARNWKKTFAPGLITCGVDDYERYRISRDFIFHFRESGGKVIWIPYRNKDHALTKDSLDAAIQFFEDQLEQKKVFCIGDDDTRQAFLPDDETVQSISEEYRNYLTSEKLAELWKDCR